MCSLANPKCEGGNCGEWKRPTKKNPEYKGKWRAPMIDNPAYKGVWAPRKIDNPNYFEDKTPSNLEPIGAIGVEIWTMQKDSEFVAVAVFFRVNVGSLITHAFISPLRQLLPWPQRGGREEVRRGDLEG